MKKFVNTAKIEYLDGEEIKSVFSNSVSVSFMMPSQYISGEVLCRRGCRRWTVMITEKELGRCAFKLNGYSGKGFYFEINPNKQYSINFWGDENSVMRLYNIPDCTTVCHENI